MRKSRAVDLGLGGQPVIESLISFEPTGRGPIATAKGDRGTLTAPKSWRPGADMVDLEHPDTRSVIDGGELIQALSAAGDELQTSNCRRCPGYCLP